MPSQKSTFVSPYIGFGTGIVKRQFFLFGMIALAISVGLCFLIEAGTDFNSKISMIISIILSDASVTYIFYKIHGEYELTQNQLQLFGKVRTSKVKLKIVCLVFGVFVGLPALIILAAIQLDTRWIIVLITCIGYILSIVLLIIILAYFNSIDSQTQKKQTTQNNQIIRDNKSTFDNSNQTTISYLNVPGRIHKNQFKVSNPLVVKLRDLFPTFINILQSVIAVCVFLYIPFSIFMTSGGIRHQIEQCVVQKTIIFRNITGNKQYNQSSYNYWVIVGEDKEQIITLPDGRNVTSDTINDLLQAGGMYSDAVFKQSTSSQRLKNYDNIWKQPDGNILRKMQQTDNGDSFKIMSNKMSYPVSLYKSGPDTFINAPYTYDSFIYISNNYKLFTLSEQSPLYFWKFPIKESNETHFIAKWNLLIPGPGQMSFTVKYSCMKADNSSQTLQMYEYSYLQTQKNIDQISASQIQIDFLGVFDRRILFMPFVNLTRIKNYTSTKINPLTGLKFTVNNITYDYFSFIWDSVIFFDQLNRVKPFIKINYWIQKYFVTIFLGTMNGQVNQVYAMTSTNTVHQDFRWGQQVKNLQFLQKYEDYVFVYNAPCPSPNPDSNVDPTPDADNNADENSQTDPNTDPSPDNSEINPENNLSTTKHVNYFQYQIICFIIGSGSFFSSIILLFLRCLLKKCIKLYPQNRKENLLIFKDFIIHFVLNLIIFSIGALPYFYALRYSDSIDYQIVQFNKKFAFVFTTFLYYMIITSWNSNLYRPYLFKVLSWVPQMNFKYLYQKTLEQNGVDDAKELIQMLFVQGYSMQFINSNLFRLAIQKQKNPETLLKQLKKITSNQKRNLYTMDNQIKIKKQTLQFSYPILITHLLALCYTFSAHMLKIQTELIVIQSLGVLIIISGVVSVFYLMWQHRNQVVIRDRNGNMRIKDTDIRDLWKIACLGFFMALMELSFSFLGYFLGQLLGFGISKRFLLSFLLCLGGYLLAYLIHLLWNYFPGIQGIIIQQENQQYSEQELIY